MKNRKIVRIIAAAGLGMLAVAGVSATATAATSNPSASPTTAGVIGKYSETFNIVNNTGTTMRISIQTNGDGTRNGIVEPGQTFHFVNWTGKNREVFRFSGDGVDHPEVEFSGQAMYNFGQWTGLVFQPGPIAYQWQVHSAGAFLGLTTR